MVRAIILILLIVPECMITADEFEFTFGSITPHFFMSESMADKTFDHKTKEDSRIITNPVVGVKGTERYGKCYTTRGMFVGQDSIGSSIVGAVTSKGMVSKSNWYTGFIFGGYLYNTVAWKDKEVMPFGPKSHGTGLVPVIGFEFNKKIKLGRKTFMKFNNAIMPAMSNHTVSIGWEF